MTSSYIDLEKYDILEPVHAIKRDGMFYLWHTTSYDSIIARINPKDNTVIQGVSEGQGPGEIIPGISFQIWRDTLLIYEANRTRYHVVNDNGEDLYLSDYREISKDPSVGFISKIHLLTDGYIIQGIQQGLDNAWLSTYNNENSVTSTIAFPDYEAYEGVDSWYIGFILSGTIIALSPDKQKIVCTHRSGGSSIYFGVIKNGNSVHEVKRWNYQAPILRKVLLEGVEATVETRLSPMSFMGLACSDKYVYAVYAGRTIEEYGITEAFQGDHLLIYDWKGNPVKHYLLEKPLYSLGYEEETQTLYGISYDPEGVLVEYQLNEEGL
jgi:hypothetical protein